MARILITVKQTVAIISCVINCNEQKMMHRANASKIILTFAESISTDNCHVIIKLESNDS